MFEVGQVVNGIGSTDGCRFSVMSTPEDGIVELIVDAMNQFWSSPGRDSLKVNQNVHIKPFKRHSNGEKTWWIFEDPSLPWFVFDEESMTFEAI